MEVVISIHDVAATTVDRADRLREKVTQIAGPGPISLLAVPRYHGQGLDGQTAAWLRERACAGDEVAAHGFFHLSPRGGDGAEFTRQRTVDDTQVLVDLSVHELQDLGLSVDGFIAPAYGHPGCLEHALRRSRFSWWATRSYLCTRHGKRWLPSVGVGASRAMRRSLSPAASRLGVWAFRRSPCIRVDLHPADLSYRRLTEAVLRRVEETAGQDRKMTTHHGLLGTMHI